jgi:hypothetical protein
MAMLRGPKHHYELWNAAYQKAFGPRDLTGRTFLEAFPEVTGQEFVEALDEVYRTGQAFSARRAHVALRRPGSDVPEDRYIDLAYQAIRDADGEITGVLVQGLDVTTITCKASSVRSK